MLRTLLKFTPLIFIAFFLLTACRPTPRPTQPTEPTAVTEAPVPTSLPTPTPIPARVLTVCLGSEPDSLFLYGDSSAAARSVRQAIYDGPFELREFQYTPVILETMPSQAGGDALLEPVQVGPGSAVIDAGGNLISLGEGVTYLPAGCLDASCALAYTGQAPVSMDQLVVRFRLRSGLLWSDGSPLTADDSLYAYELAGSLFPRVRSDLIARTHSYTAPDPVTVEWRGVPGFLDARYAANFFTPLPRHAWGALAPEDLFAAEISSRAPLGWGPYVIQEWTPGDHITLSKNPNYFRAAEGLPRFDLLVYRFLPDAAQALTALQSGECDYVDETAHLETLGAQLQEGQAAGNLAALIGTGTAWEHADFGIVPYAPPEQTPALRPALFQLKEARQAVAMCIDRQRLAQELFGGLSQVPDTYVFPGHPLSNPEVRRYTFDPQAASQLLQSIGWLDSDNNPGSPRVAAGVVGVPDGTPFQFTYLTTDEPEKQRAAQVVQESLAQCGIQAEISPQPWDELMAAGPEGQVFGRNFELVQFGWTAAPDPPCFLYTTVEIPGPYPQFTRGWGGANASGYSSPAFDAACRQAGLTLPEMPQHAEAHRQAQAIFAEDLPSIPLYLRLKAAASRPDFCNASVDPSAESSLWNLEAFDVGDGCPAPGDG